MITAIDAAGASASHLFTIHVVNVNDSPPSKEPTDDSTPGTFYRFEPRAMDADTNTGTNVVLTFSVEHLPLGPTSTPHRALTGIPQ